MRRRPSVWLLANAPPSTYIEDDYIELEVAGEPVEQVSNLIYLGVTISVDGKIDRDFDVRIQRANGAFHQLWKIWNSRPRSVCTRWLSSQSCYMDPESEIPQRSR